MDLYVGQDKENNPAQFVQGSSAALSLPHEFSGGFGV